MRALETRSDAAGEVRELVTRHRWKAHSFWPMGDNHHHAALCPYCSPPRGPDAPSALLGCDGTGKSDEEHECPIREFAHAVPCSTCGGV